MILSYRKRASSPSADCQIIPNPAIRDQPGARGQDPAQQPQTKNESPSKARRNKPFASFFQNLFVANASNGNSTPNQSAQNPNKDEPGGSSKDAEGDQNAHARRDSSYHNEAYVFSSPSPSSCSSSAESINTVLSTNSFAFVHPKKYGGKKRHGKRIPVDTDGDELPREPVPVKLKVQHAQPLPNSRRKKLSTLSRLGMKIGLKSKYNLQSCESLQNAVGGSRSGSLRREKTAQEEAQDGNDTDRGRGRSSKRRAPLPPSAQGHGQQVCSSRSFRLPPGPSASSSTSAAVHVHSHHHESVHLKSITSLGSFDRLPPMPKPPKPTSTEGPDKNKSGSDAAAACTNMSTPPQPVPLQLRRYHSDGHHGHGQSSRPSASAARVYHHVRGKRKAPVPPVRLITVTKIGVGEPQSARTPAWAASNPQPSARLGIGTSTSTVSEDERIIQDILNVNPPAPIAAALALAAKEPTSGSGSISISSTYTSAVASRYPWRNQNSRRSPNMATSPVNPGLLQQQLKHEQHSQNTNTSTKFAASASASAPQQSQKLALSLPMLTQAQVRKSPITATLGCYESFEEDDDDHLSTNSLLVHEKRLNDQVRSQLTKARGTGNNCASPPSTSSSRMPFSFFRKNTDKDKESGRAQYATAANTNGLSNLAPASAVSQNQDPETKTSSSTDAMIAVSPPVKMTPRPWYKRSSKEKANTTGSAASVSGTSTAAGTGVGNASPSKAKPSISILTNISELDRQAAEIVEEKRRRSAIEQNESAKKLISMFNTAFSAQSTSTSKNQGSSSSSAQSSSNYANAVTLPSSAATGAGPSQSSGGPDERKKLAIVQPQAKAQIRPISTPNSSTVVESSASVLGLRPSGAETSVPSVPAEDWSCPRCTLQNAHWRSFCDACHFRQGSTVVHSIASMFETNRQNQTPERRGSGSGDAGAFGSSRASATSATPPAASQSAGQSVPPTSTAANAITSVAPVRSSTSSATQANQAINTSDQRSLIELPPENLLCHTKEKSEKEKKLDGIKLHADDPEVEELDLEKLREARLAFFARHKVSSPPAGTAAHVISTKLTTCSSKSATGNNLKHKPSKLANINSNNLNQFLLHAHDEKDNNDDSGRQQPHANGASGSVSAEESEEEFDSAPAPVAFSAQKWKPFNLQKKTQISRNSGSDNRQCPNVPIRNYELDPTYENWHLKLSERGLDGDDDDDGGAVAGDSAFIRKISSEIKDQLDYFDRLKSQLRRQRSPADGLDDSEFSNSESDASTVIDARNFDVIMENRRLRQLQMEERGGPQLHFGAESSLSSSSGRRRISLGDPIPNSNPGPSSSRPFLHRNTPSSSSARPSYGSFERNDDLRAREFYERSRPRSHSQQPDFSQRNGAGAQASGLERERRQQNRALEHSASAISKQLRKLEWAINVGDHKLAASLAHDLAILKASCNKVPEEPIPQPITIRVYVEDRFMQQGPFQVPVTASTTVRELKAKIERDWGIPVLFQKWILGRKIAEDNEQTLTDYEVAHDSMAFLYLVTPNNGKPQESDGGNGNEDSVQIMAHLAKSPPVSRKIVPEIANDSKEAVDKEVAVAPSRNGAQSEPDRGSSSCAVKHEPISAKSVQSPASSSSSQTNKPIQTKATRSSVIEDAKKPSLAAPRQAVASQDENLPQTVPEPKSQKPPLASSNNGQQETTAGIGIPKSNKTVTSKYIESIKQTNSEEPPLSPENSILKQNIHAHAEKMNLSRKTTNSEKQSGEATPSARPQPLSPSATQSSTQQENATGVPGARTAAVRVERLLETSTELSKKCGNQTARKQPLEIQTPAPAMAIRKVVADNPEASFEENQRQRVTPNTKLRPNSSPVLKHEPHTPNLKAGTGIQARPSLEVQAQEQEHIVPTPPSHNDKPPMGQSQSQSKAAAAQFVQSVAGHVVKSPELAPRISNEAPRPQAQALLNKPDPGVNANNTDGKSKSKHRWNLPQPHQSSASSSKSAVELENEKILIRRKDSDAVDINLQVEESLPKETPVAVAASSSGPSGAAAAAGAKILDKEDNTETYRKMLQLMENEDCVRNTEELECPVCFSKVGVGDGVTLRDCLHGFCRECLAGTIQYSDEPQVKCPFRDAKYSCESFLQEREIKGLVSPIMFERHLAQAVKLAENKIANTFHCKTNDCTGWCIFEDDVNVFKCPVCRKSNCLTCQAIHEGKNCQEYQRELAINAETDEGAKSSRIMLEKMIQRGEALECPACHVVLLKKWGCDWVRCSYCKTEICWVTKSFRWGKNGKGDTSGGCRCGVNGVKCHPKCTYCH